MKIDEVVKIPSMPAASPSYPFGPFRFCNREYFIISYETDPEAISSALPEPLIPDGSNRVLFEFIRMPDSSGFGDYNEAGVVIPAISSGERVNFVYQMFLDNFPAIVGGREIWGFPKKHATSSLLVINDTLTGSLSYANTKIATGTMTYKHINLAHLSEQIISQITKTQVTLKIIPDVDGSLAIAQLVSFNLSNVTLKGAWSGTARLHLIPHANAPVSDFPVYKIIDSMHFIADLTLPYGKVIHNYL